MAAALTLAALAAGPAAAGEKAVEAGSADTTYTPAPQSAPAAAPARELDVTGERPAVQSAQEPETGATQEGPQTDEDDEELGEEIPEEDDKSSGEGNPPTDGGTSTTGRDTPRDDPPPSDPDRLPQTGSDPIPLVLFGLLLVLAGRRLRRVLA